MSYGRLQILAKFPVDRESRLPGWQAGEIVVFGLPTEDLVRYGQPEKNGQNKNRLECCGGGESQINPTLFRWSDHRSD